MRGTSRASLAELKERLAATLDAVQAGAERADRPARPSPEPAWTLGEELFAVVGLLDREHFLRRAVSDPAKPGDEKAEVMRSLLAGKLSGPAVELAATAAALRWSSPRDLTDSLAQIAVLAVVTGAEADGRLDELEDELFRFGRVVADEPRLRAVLSDPAAPAEGKEQLLLDLLGGKVTESTMRLVTQAAQHPRGRTLDRSLDEYSRLAAEWRQRLIAIVRTTTELSNGQRRRLAASLAAMYGHEVHINVVLDPEVIGGLSIQIGDEIIDGTLSSKLGAVRRRMAG